MNKKFLIGFIGQGFIGKNYADDFENRGYRVIRYAQEAPYQDNKDRISGCDLVFIAVPTPTTKTGFNTDILKEVLALVGKGKTAIIKSTILPGTCANLKKLYPNIYIFHSPEFLREKTAADDASHPTRNIIGMAEENKEYQQRAKEILSILPKSPVNIICKAKEAELIKYGANAFLYLKVVYANILFDLAKKEGSDWEKIKEGLAADPRIGASHLDPVHASGLSKKNGRGAGGHCFIKDFAALREYLDKVGDDELGLNFFKAAEEKNIELLRNSGKDEDLLEDIYGK